MKRRKMQRNVVPQLVQNPVHHPLELLIVIVRVRDYQIGDFEPDIGLAAQPDKRIQYGLEVGKRELLVERFRKRLQVDVGRVDRFKERLASRCVDVAGRYGHRLDPVSSASSRGIHRVLGPNHRIVVGKGDAAATELSGRTRNRFRRRLFAQLANLARLRDRPVLTELTS